MVSRERIKFLVGGFTIAYPVSTAHACSNLYYSVLTSNIRNSGSITEWLLHSESNSTRDNNSIRLTTMNNMVTGDGITTFSLILSWQQLIVILGEKALMR